MRVFLVYSHIYRVYETCLNSHKRTHTATHTLCIYTFFIVSIKKLSAATRVGVLRTHTENKKDHFIFLFSNWEWFAIPFHLVPTVRFAYATHKPPHYSTSNLRTCRQVDDETRQSYSFIFSIILQVPRINIISWTLSIRLWVSSSFSFPLANSVARSHSHTHESR